MAGPKRMTTMVREAGIGVGSNLGDRHEHIRRAASALRSTPHIGRLEIGPIIETTPVLPADANPDQPMFLNTVFVVSTSLVPTVLMARLLAVESSLGRRRDGTTSPRTIDLDLLYVGTEVVDERGLSLPHPRMWERDFVCGPLESLRPGIVQSLRNTTGM